MSVPQRVALRALPSCAAQAKYGPLTADHPAVERGRAAEPLPTWAQFSARAVAAKKLTVRDVWGLMLTSLPGALHGLCCTPLLFFIFICAPASRIVRPWTAHGLHQSNS